MAVNIPHPYDKIIKQTLHFILFFSLIYIFYYWSLALFRYIYFLFLPTTQIILNSLCFAVLEFSFTAALILSTHIFPTKYRIKGFLSLFIVFHLFNIFRIYIIIKTLSISQSLSEFLHLFFFKLSFIIFIAFFYWIWFLLGLKHYSKKINNKKTNN